MVGHHGGRQALGRRLHTSQRLPSFVGAAGEGERLGSTGVEAGDGRAGPIAGKGGRLVGQVDDFRQRPALTGAMHDLPRPHQHCGVRVAGLVGRTPSRPPPPAGQVPSTGGQGEHGDDHRQLGRRRGETAPMAGGRGGQRLLQDGQDRPRYRQGVRSGYPP
jgi:hypothetical protein